MVQTALALLSDGLFGARSEPGDPSTWPGSQRRWCCEHSRLGCGAEAVEKVYDCTMAETFTLLWLSDVMWLRSLWFCGIHCVLMKG